ncbi:MAG TPA: VOC family protein [Vicinamibacteria bacterium]|nr:VOC family protein [Vicinamibacteria bacterium]
MERLRIHHLALRVSDCERAAGFYLGVLGLPELRRFDDAGRLRSIWLRAGEAVIMLEHGLRGLGPDAGSGHVLALAVDSLEEWESRLGAAGVPIDDRTAHTLFVRDPDGHRVGLTVFPAP